MKNPSYLILVLTVVLAVSLTACGGGGAAAPAAEAAPPTPAGNAANGKALFEQATIGKSNALGCATCHSRTAGRTATSSGSSRQPGGWPVG